MCKSPLYAYRPRYTFLDDDEGVVEVFKNGSVHSLSVVRGEIYNISSTVHFCKSFDEWSNLKTLKPDYEFLRIPCGQCIECRLSYSKEWACRIICEQLLSRSSLFVTLTYDDEHIPLNDLGLSYLDYSHLSNFIKRLREFIFRRTGERDLRYYAAGEYGSSSARAHFHICLFNLPQFILDELKFYKSSFSGDVYYFNSILEQIWGNGYVVCGELNYLSAAYVARYVCKKLKGKASQFYLDNHLTSEQSRMSLKPGIGREFYNRNRDLIYKNDEFFLPVVGRVMSSRYFDKLYQFDNPEEFEFIKAKRSVNAENYFAEKLKQTDLDELSLLKSELSNLEARCKKLVRPLD